MNQKKAVNKTSIDWHEQWALFGRNFLDGFVHLDLRSLGPFEGSIRLKPGPGFGDLSHSTTCLVLSMLANHCRGLRVCDIGCGSGILSLAAIAFGATHVDAIDIDPYALNHSCENAVLNKMEKQISFFLPGNYEAPAPSLIVMNMISSEQKMAWHSLPALHGFPLQIIVSGILEEHKARYIKELPPSWSFQEEYSEDGWCALRFIQRV